MGEIYPLLTINLQYILSLTIDMKQLIVSFRFFRYMQGLTNCLVQFVWYGLDIFAFTTETIEQCFKRSTMKK